MNEISTAVEVVPNCKYILLKFQEPGPDGFSLELQLLPADTLCLAYQLQKAAHDILEEEKS